MRVLDFNNKKPFNSQAPALPPARGPPRLPPPPLPRGLPPPPRGPPPTLPPPRGPPPSLPMPRGPPPGLSSPGKRKSSSAAATLSKRRRITGATSIAPERVVKYILGRLKSNNTAIKSKVVRIEGKSLLRWFYTTNGMDYDVRSLLNDNVTSVPPTVIANFNRTLTGIVQEVLSYFNLPFDVYELMLRVLKLCLQKLIDTPNRNHQFQFNYEDNLSMLCVICGKGMDDPIHSQTVLDDTWRIILNVLKNAKYNENFTIYEFLSYILSA